TFNGITDTITSRIIPKSPMIKRTIHMSASGPTCEDAAPGNRLLQPLLRIPVFYRVLLSNSLIIFVGATVGTWLATRLQTNSYYPVILVIFVAVGWLVSVVLNFVLLQIAFRPLLDLGKVMNRVQSGERSLRAPLTGLEPQADQLARTFNMM